MALADLANQNASGVLEIDGNPSGAIYLDQGRITFAWSSWTPDLAIRLRGMLSPTAESRDLLAWLPGSADDLGALLIARGFVARTELEILVSSVTLDAIAVLAGSADADAAGVSIRFNPGVVHWAAALCRLPIEVVQSEVSRLVDRIGRSGVTLDDPLELSDRIADRVIMAREQWAVAARIDGASSARDLAGACGLALHDTVERIGALIEAGLAAPCRSSRNTVSLSCGQSGLPRAGSLRAASHAGSRGNPARASAPRASAPRVTPPRAATPRAATPRVTPPRAVDSADRWSGAGQGGSVSADALQRVLDGLRRLT